MQLVEAGKVDLDQPVQRYLPYFRLKDARAASITVRQMLSHTSGMPDVESYEWEKAVADEGALERFVRSLTERELIAAPRPGRPPEGHRQPRVPLQPHARPQLDATLEPRKMGQRDLALASYRKPLELDSTLSSAARAIKELEQEVERPSSFH